MQAFGARQPLVEVRLKPVQELEGEPGVRLRIGIRPAEEARFLIWREDAQVIVRVPVAQLTDTCSGAQLERTHSAQFFSVSPTRTEYNKPVGKAGSSLCQKASARFSAVGMIPSSQATSVFKLR